MKPFFARCLFVVVFALGPACVLGQTPTPPGGLDALITNLKSPDPTVRLRACEGIGALGPRAKSAVPALVDMLNGTSTIDRIAAARALARIGPDAEAALPALEAAQNGGDERVKSAAKAAAEAISPPLMTVASNAFRNPYVLAGAIALGAGLVVLVLLGFRRGDKIPEAKWKEDQAKAAARSASSATAPAATPKPAPPASPKPAAQPAAAPKPAGTERLGGMPRARVSKPLLGLENYVQETAESPDSIKRDFARAQEELKKLVSLQEDLAKTLAEDKKLHPERARVMKKNLDEYAIEHYKLDVRVKALEIKVIEALLGDGNTADPGLLERTEAKLKEKWDAVRVLLETPSKIVYTSGQWVSVPTGTTAPVADPRARVRDFGVIMHERPPVVARAPQPAEPPSTATRGAAPFELPDESDEAQALEEAPSETTDFTFSVSDDVPAATVEARDKESTEPLDADGLTGTEIATSSDETAASEIVASTHEVSQPTAEAREQAPEAADDEEATTAEGTTPA